MLTWLRARFESQLLAVKERLEAAKVGSTRGLAGGGGGSSNATSTMMAPPSSSSGAFGGGNPFARIAKPLRGGGEHGGLAGGFAGHQQQAGGGEGDGSGSGNGKRGSWFFNQRG